jgi:hypothetical protein
MGWTHETKPRHIDTTCIHLCLYFCDFDKFSIKSRLHLWEYIKIRAELHATSQSELVYQRYKTIVQLGLEYGPIRFYSLYRVTPTLVNASLVQQLQKYLKTTDQYQGDYITGLAHLTLDQICQDLAME